MVHVRVHVRASGVRAMYAFGGAGTARTHVEFSRTQKHTCARDPLRALGLPLARIPGVEGSNVSAEKPERRIFENSREAALV